MNKLLKKLKKKVDKEVKKEVHNAIDEFIEKEKESEIYIQIQCPKCKKKSDLAINEETLLALNMQMLDKKQSVRSKERKT